MSTKPHVLILEDLLPWAKVIQDCLSEQYEVTVADSLTQAVSLLTTELFDLALVDISLVPMDPNHKGGFHFIAYLRSSDLLIDLPVIILTGYDSEEYMHEAFKEYQVYEFLAKDQFDPEKLNALVARAMAERHGFFPIDSPPRALVLDDNPGWQSEIKQILEDEGCQVDTASTYAEAINMLISRVYQFATIDIRLEDINSTDTKGIEFADMVMRLRQLDSFIIISAFANDKGTRSKAADLGALDVIDKGDFDENRLRSRARYILRRLVYVTVDLGTIDDATPLVLGTEYTVRVSVSRSDPHHGLTRSLRRPVPRGRPFDLTAMIHLYSFDVSPGTMQNLHVTSNDSAEPVEFRISPTVEGRIQLSVEFWYGELMRTYVSRAFDVGVASDVASKAPDDSVR